MAKEELYYTLLLTQTNAILSLVKIEASDSKIIKKSQLYFSDFQELENQLKEALEKEKETNNLILFLTHHYLETKTNTLKPEYKEVFSRIFKNAKLEPMGYIETYEAIVNYLTKKQEFPLNALIVEVEKSSISLTLAKGGKTKKTLTKLLTNDLQQTILELLNSSFEKPLPAKIYLLNFCEEKEENIEELNKLKWPKDLFLQHPEIKILNQEKINLNLIKVFAQELNKEQEQTEQPQKKEKTLPLGFASSEKELEEGKPPISLPSLHFPFSTFKLPELFKLQFFKLQLFKLPKITSFPKIYPLILLSVTVPVLALAHELFFHIAIVNIYPKTKEINLEKSISFNKESPFFYLAKKSFSLKKTYQSTGEKKVGKKATGTLKFYNFSAKELTLTPKTKITYKDKVYFLKEKLTVPSATEEASGDSIIKKPGTKTGKIEAENIGEKYNLSTSDKLNIAGLNTDLYFAKIEGKISGGTSEKVKTVTKSDLQKAREDIKKEALNKIDINNLQPDPENYLPLKSLITSSIVKEKFDKEIGDISDNFTLNAKVEVEVPFINKKELVKNFEEELLSQTSSDYTLDPKKFNIQVKTKKTDSQKTTLDIALSGRLFQKVNPENLKNLLKGKPIKEITISLPKNIAKIEVLKNTAFLPFFSNRLPYKAENIKIQLKY